MKLRKISLLIGIIVLLSVSSQFVFADAFYSSPIANWTLFSDTFGSPGVMGTRVMITFNDTVINLTKYAGDSATECKFLSASLTQLANGSFVGDQCVINYNITGVPKNGTIFWVAAYANTWPTIRSATTRPATWSNGVLWASDATNNGLVAGSIDTTPRSIQAITFQNGSSLLPPSPVVFVSQVPSDITSTSLFSIQNVNITYNLANISNIITNSTSPYINYTITGITGCWNFQNGTCQKTGYVQKGYATNTSYTFLFQFGENDIYPIVSNAPATIFNQTHTRQIISNNNLLKWQFLNFSAYRNSNTLEIDTLSTDTSGTTNIYACNSTYTSGIPSTTPTCTLISSYTNVSYNHSHFSGLSNHSLFTIPVNTTSQKINNLLSVNDSIIWIVMQGANVGTDTVGSVPTTSRTNSVYTSINGGNTWTLQTYTIDSHIHQFNTADAFQYQGCAQNSTGTFCESTTHTDNLDITILPPSPVTILTPNSTNASFSQPNILINYTASIPFTGATINRYNISLFSQTNTYLRDIAGNNSLNLSYSWDYLNQSITVGTYVINVRAYDNFSNFADSDSVPFNITRDAQLNISFYDSVTNATLTNINLTISDLTNGQNETTTITTNSTLLYIIKGHNYVFTMDKTGYAITNTTYTTTNTYNQLNVSMFLTNSIQFNIFNSVTFAPVLQTVNIIMIKGLSSLIFNTTTSSYFASAIPEGTYTVTVMSANYSQNTFTLTMTNRTTQTVNVFLTNFFDSFSFYAINPNNQPIQNVSITVQSLVNGSYVTISNKFTDVLGFALFQITSGNTYHFVMTPPGEFISKVFDMEVFIQNSPYKIIFTSGGLTYYNSLYESATYDYFPTNTTLINGTYTFGIRSLSINGTILYTQVNCSGGNFSNVSGFPGGATAQVTVDLSQYSGTFTCNYQMAVDQFPVLSFNQAYFITSNTGYPNSNLITAADKTKAQLSTMASGRAWTPIIAIFIVFIIAITAHQLSGGQSRISTVAALAGIILFASLGWLSQNSLQNWAIAAFIVLIGGFITFYKEAY